MQDRDGTPLTRYDIKLGGEVDLRGAGWGDADLKGVTTGVG